MATDIGGVISADLCMTTTIASSPLISDNNGNSNNHSNLI